MSTYTPIILPLWAYSESTLVRVNMPTYSSLYIYIDKTESVFTRTRVILISAYKGSITASTGEIGQDKGQGRGLTTCKGCGMMVMLGLMIVATLAFMNERRARRRRSMPFCMLA